MSVSKKSFVLNNSLVNMTKAHITQLFQPTFNPAKDVGSTSYFSLPFHNIPTTSVAEKNPIPNIYNYKNVVTNLFLVTENFLTLMNALNKSLHDNLLQTKIVPVNYTYTAGSGFSVVPDTANKNLIMNAFNGPAGNNVSDAFNSYEKMAEFGVEGNINYDGCVSSSVTELFLRHLYSKDKEKRKRAFAFAKSFYGMNATLVNGIEANNEMIPAEDFDSDLFQVTVTGDIIQLNYPTPIKFIDKYVETINNPGNKKLFLYFPYITSNAMRGNDDTKFDYRDSQISLFTGLKTASLQAITHNTYLSLNAMFNSTFTGRSKAATGVGALYRNADMPTLTNTIWSKVKGKVIDQMGYTALRITQVGGGGDIQFDYINKIDYIDSLTIGIKAPTVFS